MSLLRKHALISVLVGCGLGLFGGIVASFDFENTVVGGIASVVLTPGMLGVTFFIGAHKSLINEWVTLLAFALIASFVWGSLTFSFLALLAGFYKRK
jgi:hypothetical protein